MARHRSPEGRRAHLELPLSAALATAGAGGAYRTVAYQQGSSTSGSGISGLSGLTQSMPARFIATAVAGTAIAATGQHLLVQAVPIASDGAAALRAGMGELLGDAPTPVSTPDAPALQPTFQPISAAAAAPLTAPLTTDQAGTVAPVGGDPVVVDAAGLVKAADLQRVAAEQEAQAAEQARAAEEARAQAEAQARAEANNRQAGVGATVSGAAGLFTEGTFTSGFGTRNGTAHEGVDIAAPIGTPIHVPLDGTVIDSGPATGFGLWVRVQHEDGTITTYGHVNRALVNVGDEVSAGDVIAEVGNRGESTGPHLHFEVTNPDGIKINPRPWLAELGIEL